MHSRRFGPGRLERKFRCPGLSFHRRAPGKERSIGGTDWDYDASSSFDSAPTTEDRGATQYFPPILLLAVTVLRFLSSLAYSISLHLAHAIVALLSAGVEFYHDSIYLPQLSAGNAFHGRTHQWLDWIARVISFGISPLFIVSPRTRRAQERHARVERRKKTAIRGLILQELQRANDVEDVLLTSVVRSYVRKKRISRVRRQQAASRTFRQRKTWSDFQTKLTDRQFRRYFRMSRECFDELSRKIVLNVGEDVFKSEEYLCELLEVDDRKCVTASLARAHALSTGGFISGEIKLALTLRLLAGGSYLDLGLLFEIGTSYAYEIFHDVIENWIMDDRLVNISGVDYVSDDDAMSRVALQFARASQGTINGCIGAIDGWVVKIKRPQRRDGVFNPASFYSRKGYFGINVQAIVDKKKRILYRSILSRGAEHDSTAFKNSPFYKDILMPNWREFARKGFYFVGDSAYSLKAFILTPFDNVAHATAEDNYNFFHSSARICVECAFGEIDLRWGILWRPLSFSLAHNCNVIDACMRLHNFIVDFREDSAAELALDRSVFDDDCRRFLAVTPSDTEGGVHGGEEDLRLDSNGNMYAGGRPTKDESAATKCGEKLRDELKKSIEDQGLKRPPTNWYKLNNRVFSE